MGSWKWGFKTPHMGHIAIASNPTTPLITTHKPSSKEHLPDMGNKEMSKEGRGASSGLIGLLGFVASPTLTPKPK